MKRCTFLITLLFLSNYVFAQYVVSGKHLRSYTPYDIRVQILDSEDKRIEEKNNEPLIREEGLETGQKIRLSGTKYMQVKIGDDLEPAVLFFPRKHGEIMIPELSRKINSEFSKKNLELSLVAKMNYQDLMQYRNLALNPFDWQNEAISIFPNIATNSECRNDPQFAARNVINGLTKNDGHSDWEDRSWGPEKIDDPWIEIDFGRLVEVDKLVLYIRADFPHDGYWKSATLAFSDGSEEKISIKKTAEAQTFSFSKRKIKSIRIKNLKQDKPLEWCAFAEVEVWGKEALPFEIKDSWEATLRSFSWQEGMQKDNDLYWLLLRKAFPVQADWLLKETEGEFVDFIFKNRNGEKWHTLALSAISEISDADKRQKLRKQSKLEGADFIGLYLEARQQVRKEFLSILEENGNEYVFVKRYRFTPTFFAYTEGMSDARNEHSFTPGSALCKATIVNGKVKTEVLLEDKNGVIRDPDVSFDGKRILFAWKKSYDQDDYHLYEFNVDSEEIIQLTYGENVADFEGKYLPNGDIIFNSTRCEQTVDCWKTDVSNLYLMKNDGRFMRRIGFDQVQTPYPTVMDNGKIVYTRWDYNDRGQTFPQPLFSMNPDGTAQTEYYGNNSWYPTTITHARQIPGTNKVMATICGHHTWQQGQVGIIDPSQGRQENVGVQLVAPKRKEDAVRIDRYGQNGIQFQYPYPLNEELFLATVDPINSGRHNPFLLYFLNAEGKREVLAWDERMDCKQVVPLAPRKKAFVKPTKVDYSKNSGTYYVQNVYHGPGAKGIKKGSIEKLRVVALEFRAAPIRGNHGSNNEGGVNVGNLASTPIALGQGAWDVKHVLGEVNVEEDGSAMFEVPARTPVYFQLIDTAGYVAQTMRSWSTLQPGEAFSCIGCHEDKNESVPMMNKSLAMAKGVQKLEPFYDVSGGFSFKKHVQPILDKNCISCHNNREVPMLNNRLNSVADLVGNKAVESNNEKIAFSLLNEPVNSYAGGREWNDAYLNLLQATYDVNQHERHRTYKGSFKSDLVNWPGMQSVPTLLPPYYRGAATSKLMKMLKRGHGKTNLSQEELDIISCWIDLQVPYCGDYKEANIWSEKEMEYYDYYLNKRLKNSEEEKENIKALLEYLNPE